ncbi:PepSY domain-containing protein [Pleurocapsales cyanobacterium LEGE 06147]|nr:PepSY domain-containing protein [Pleurocapsales cyanobacterium LEGE 06147]
MKVKRLRSLTFYLHRYIRLAVGLILVIVGLTGSILVFREEIDHFLLLQRTGTIVPQGNPLPIQTLLETLQPLAAKHPNLTISAVSFYPKPTDPIRFWLTDNGRWEIAATLNPYTGKLLDTYNFWTSFSGFFYSLHYELLAGEIGLKIVGIVALLTFVLSFTGLILWPGWRKLMAGFKIKWNAHPKRVNFDIHKVVGMIAAVFLAMTAFTGFCWNFYDVTVPIIYAATFTPEPTAVVSTPIAHQTPITPDVALLKANAALPEGRVTYLGLPTKPEDTYSISKKLPNENGNSFVYIDRYSGKVLRVDDSPQAKLGDRILNSFTPLHYGTFGGLLTRILYVFVGLAPTILLITGFVMWRYRRRVKGNSM